MFVTYNYCCYGKHTSLQKQNQKSAASLFSRKASLGAPIHIKMSSKTYHIYYYTLLLLGVSIILDCYWIAIGLLLAIWKDGFKLRVYRKAESYIRLIGEKITKRTHVSQHPKLQILGPHLAPPKD